MEQCPVIATFTVTLPVGVIWFVLQVSPVSQSASTSQAFPEVEQLLSLSVSVAVTVFVCDVAQNSASNLHSYLPVEAASVTGSSPAPDWPESVPSPASLVLTPHVVPRTLPCTLVISPNLSSLSVLRSSGSTVSVFCTFTLYLTTAHWRLSAVLVTVAVGATPAMETSAVAHAAPDPPTAPPFASVPLAHTRSVIVSPASPETGTVNVQVAKPPA